MERQKILIIDDDPNIRKTLSDILKVKGYEPFSAKSGMEGIDLLKQSSADIAVIDLGLPDISGIEVLSRVKADRPFTEAIILTGNASLDSAIEATNKGAFSYLLKPYELDQLMLHIRRAIEKQQAQKTIAAHRLKLEKMNVQMREANTDLIHEIAERKRAEEALLNSEQKLKAVLYNSPIPQFVIDRDHQVVYWNNALEEITRIRASEIIGTNQHWRAFYSAKRSCLADLMVDGDIERIPELYQGKYSRSKLVAGAYEATDYFPALGEDGKWLFFTAAAIRDVSGQVIGALETLEDITERKQAEQEILTLSITDQLTGLHNRRGFITLVEQQLKLSDRTKSGMLLFFADLDGMKWINDTLGHDEGDKALIEAANILKETFRASDVIARMGGDEFAILAINTTEVNSEILTGRLQSLIYTHNHQENRRYRLSISLGCSCYDPENPCSLDELMAEADKLMYEQKRRKKSCR